jgi:hypothetical protein
MVFLVSGFADIYLEIERAGIQLHGIVFDCLYLNLRYIPQLLPNVNLLYSLSILTNSLIDRLENVKIYGNGPEAQTAMYDRDHPRYPYKSHGQWLKACYGMIACTILLIFNGVAAFLEDPFDTRRFIASYIGVS